MKLTDNQIAQIQDQLEADPVPAESPAGKLLASHFGDHTFYVDDVGVHVFEAESANDENVTAGRVVPMRVASWTNEKKDSLSRHEPIQGGAGALIDFDE